MITRFFTKEKDAGWLKRLKQGLSRSSTPLTKGLTQLLTNRKLDAATLESLEELLIAADLGPQTAAEIIKTLSKDRFEKDVSLEDVRKVLAQELAKDLIPKAQPLGLDASHHPHVILVVGVNGAGKTTTIGKLAAQFQQEGKSVLLAAGDTFRAAAVEQLKIWGTRTHTPVIAKETGADAAGLAYEALEQARRDKKDVLLIDTAGRLHNKKELMAELQKIIRVLKKLDPTAPHTTLLILDATTGQNAISQVQTFQEMVAINGLIVTKLDGSAHGGILVAMAKRFNLPIHAVGVGEGVEDLQPFDPIAFTEALVGL